MSDKILVPEGMLRAAIDASGITNHITIAKAVKAVLGWLSKNPIVPTEEQATALFASIEHPVGATGEGWGKVASDIAVEWQRHMFLKPEPEVPEEIRDLIDNCAGDGRCNSESANKRVLEAYRRGQKSKEEA